MLRRDTVILCEQPRQRRDTRLCRLFRIKAAVRSISSCKIFRRMRALLRLQKACEIVACLKLPVLGIARDCLRIILATAKLIERGPPCQTEVEQKSWNNIREVRCNIH